MRTPGADTADDEAMSPDGAGLPPWPSIEITNKLRKPTSNLERELDSRDVGGFEENPDSMHDDDHEGKEGYREGGYHPVSVGEVYNSRYKVVRKLGWGHFSTVWKTEETSTDGGETAFAMKIQKSAEHYREAAWDEIKLLQKCIEEGKKCRDSGGDGDPALKWTTSNGPRVVQLTDWFEHTGPNGQHVCMVFEVLGDSLLTLMRQRASNLGQTQQAGIGIPIPMVKHLTKQVLEGLHFLHTKCGIIHTDLKPENVLLRMPSDDSGGSSSSGESSSLSDITVSVGDKKKLPDCSIIDFGNACWVDHHFSEEIQTRQYR
jgi:serine/threonine-protein kinase SRPK3